MQAGVNKPIARAAPTPAGFISSCLCRLGLRSQWLGFRSQWLAQLMLVQAKVEEPMARAGLAPAGFINSYALNMYHDGSEGIQSHYDDADRFSRPIFSLRLFSDSRLSFGTQLYGYTNGAFCIDMPRKSFILCPLCDQTLPSCDQTVPLV